MTYREPRGDTDVLTIVVGGDGTATETLIAETAGPSPWRADDAIALQIAADRLHLFDPATGRNLAVVS